MTKLKQYAELYKNELLNNILPFWEAKSKDAINGGFFTCLDRTGEVYDTDKFIWLQGREIWCFAYMYSHVAQNESWKTMALHGANFLEKYGRDKNGNWYFSLTADGKPLIQPYNIFSDCFATMAFAALHKIEPKEEYKKIAIDTFNNIIARQHDWKGAYNKVFPGTRPMKNFSLPMILCNLALELEHIIGKEKVDEFIPTVLREVMEVFYQSEKGYILENVSPEGRFVNCHEGRLLNPGHAIEAMWFIMDLGKRMNDSILVEKATNIMLQTLEMAWDKQYGGIYYFMDCLGHPPQQLEWDQKLWWVHVETLVALAKGYAWTKSEQCAAWFEKVHDYSWLHFKDKEHPEWYGYLNRQGEPLLSLKGGKWKGCFHMPRAMYQVWNTLEAI